MVRDEKHSLCSDSFVFFKDERETKILAMGVIMLSFQFMGADANWDFV